MEIIKYQFLMMEQKPKFPENIDCCISKKCSIGCKFCYEDCTKDGKIFSFRHPKTQTFLNQLHRGTEIAIGGGALSEIDETKFCLLLEQLYQQGVITNITVNAKELLNEKFNSFLTKDRVLIPNFIHGLGISYNSNDKCKEKMLEFKKKFPKNVVIHTIVGITTPEDYQWLADNHFKVLVLGYKNMGRGLVLSSYVKEYHDWAEENLLKMRSQFKTLSFDCLAVEQLELQKQVDNDVWNVSYMGDDGLFTMYVDLVEHQFSKSSTTSKYGRNYFSFQGDNLKSMFKYIRTNN